ncbi:ORF6N domain-containing protein [Hathewaya massiliensis]|uniref:ORF6N domain-containing protein n=1 Tax=Hathewaya massiliensis TaxID=1964382 RepID=UPI00115B848E|nr:ORF6N domain-containing protein [Hathewaya massiliensis]
MSNLIPIEFKNEVVITTEQLADVYEVDVIRIQQGFSRNKDKFQEGKHYFRLTGEELKGFKGNYLKDSNLKYASELILWTKRGANRHCKILDTDKAWEQFDNLEETYFRVKEKEPTCIEDVLIQSLKEMKEVKYQLAAVKKGNEEVKEEVQAIRDVITINPKAEWRKETNRVLNSIGKKIGDYKEVKDEVYNALKEVGHCRPTILVNNLKKRATDNGMAPSKVEKLNLLDVLENEPRLKEIYINIVRQMAIKNNISWRNVE